jgi:hypothetical protein
MTMSTSSGCLHRRRHALEPAHRTQAGIEIELLAEGDVEGPDPATHGRGERSLDGDQVGANGGQGVFGEPVIDCVLGFLPGQHFDPGDLFLAAVGPGDGRVEDPLGGTPDVGAGPVALDERNDRIVGDVELAAMHGDGGTCRDGCHALKSRTAI